MKVAVLGCSGGMGSYFARRFLAEGNEVTGSDIRRAKRRPRGLRLVASNKSAVRGADLVLIAVPPRDTIGVAQEVAPSLKNGATVVEMTSVKAGVRRSLKKILSKRGVSLLSVHPLFGPLSKSLRPKICVIGDLGEVRRARTIFPGTNLLPMGEREHDRLAAYALSLVHLVNFAFLSLVVKKVGIGEFDKVATPMGALQMNLAKAVLSQDPKLYSYVQVANPFVGEVVSSLMGEFASLRKAVSSGDAGEIERAFCSLSRRFGRAELDEAIGKVYAAPYGHLRRAAALRERT